MIKKSYLILILLFIFTIFLGGCLELGENYSYRDTKKAPIEAIEEWIGAPLPSNYSELKYEVIGDAIDRQAAIAVKVPKEYYHKVIQNLIKYEDAKSAMKSDPGHYGTGSYSFMQKPMVDTTVWVSKEGFYRKYVWYQNSTLYIFYYDM